VLESWSNNSFSFSRGEFVEHFELDDLNRHKSLSIAIGCYGDFPQYSLRAVKSVINSQFPVHIAATMCCAETVSGLQELFITKQIDSLFLCNQNINKDPMMRLLIERSETEFILWLDDDSHFIDPGWVKLLQNFIDSNDFDIAGHVHYINPDAEYKRFREARPWWVGDDHFADPSHRDTSWFPTGGCFLAKLSYLRQYDFPDRLMVKKMDDILLGDLVSQSRGKLAHLPHELLLTVKISDGNRRGDGELVSDWRYDHS
jgi:hypothetical protein